MAVLTLAGNAKIEGMEADLGMKGTDYNTVNLIFFIPYVLAGKNFSWSVEVWANTATRTSE